MGRYECLLASVSAKERLGVTDRARTGRAVATRGMRVVRGGSQAGVDWATVEESVARSGIIKITEGDSSALSALDPKWWPSGVALIDTSHRSREPWR
jgi:hypothetical protein